MNLKSVEEFELEITSNCNAACPLCKRTLTGMPHYGNSSLTLQDIKQFFPDAEHISGKRFILCGVLGDPIVNPECLDICEYLLTFNPEIVFINTNASYNPPEWWTRAAELGVEVGFSVDGMRDTNHIYRVNTKWDTIERNMRAFVSAGGKGDWHYISFEHNQDDIDAAREMAANLGLRFKLKSGGRNNRIKVSRQAGRGLDKDVEIQGNKNVDNRTEANATTIKTKEAVFSRDIVELKRIATTVSCKHLKTKQVFVGSDARLYHCCYLRDEMVANTDGLSYDLYRNDVNSLREHTVEEILTSDFFSQIEKRWQPDHPAFISRCLKTCGNNAVASKINVKKM